MLLVRAGNRDTRMRMIKKTFQELPDISLGLGTKVLETLTGYTKRRCWKACVSNYECQSALHVLGVQPNECHLLDSVAEHRLISIPPETHGSLLYSINRREMEAPPLGWNDTMTGLGTLLTQISSKESLCTLETS